MLTSIQNSEYFLNLTSILLLPVTAISIRMRMILVNDVDICFGGFKYAVCVDFEIPHDVALVVLGPLLGLIAIRFLLDFKFIFSRETSMQMRGHCI